tara:strand:+ start:109 stop:372 length:264 start_codon:yes stop_codon:yes gene_type:complete
MIPDFKKGDTVMWCPDEYPFEATVGILLGFYDGETDEQLPSQYDASNVLVNALVHFPWGDSLYTPLHELIPLKEFIQQQEQENQKLS